jgi:hypothetical protein
MKAVKMFRIPAAGGDDAAAGGQRSATGDSWNKPPPRLPSAEDAAADLQRLTAALRERSAAAPDNVVELAALNVDLRRASAVWRLVVPTGSWQ